MDSILFAVAVCLSFAVPYFQARHLAGYGSDYYVHVFLSNVIRENNHQLFSRVPRMLNESYCGAYPLFLHWILSFLSQEQIKVVARYLNASVSIVLTCIVYGITKSNATLSPIAGMICLCLAISPQFYHTSNARGFGISSRAIGLLLLMVFALCVYEIGVSQQPLIAFGVAVLFAYLIWGFNTFAQQAIILFGMLLGVFFGNWTMLVAALIALLPFVLMHRDYAPSYLKHTLLFIKTYATDVADVFILKQRYSIWRDLVYDIWARIIARPIKGFLYAYNNSFLIVLCLNPLIFFAASLVFRSPSLDPLLSFSVQMAVVGLGTFLITSFRATRFLGEPERYLEMVAAFSTIAGVWVLYSWSGHSWVLAVVGYFFVATSLQLILAVITGKRLSEEFRNLSLIETAIDNAFQGQTVRFTSNNDQLVKLMMTKPWYFVRLWSAETLYGGYKFREIVWNMPFLRREPFEKVVQQYQINACLLDKSNFGDIFTDSTQSQVADLLLETEEYQLYRLRW